MKVIMKYPKIDGNTLCDGTAHDIHPTKISKFYINDSAYFLLEYFDEKFECNSFTILRKDGFSFLKIPLKNYNSFNEKIKTGKIKLEEEDLLTLDGIKTIFTEQPIDNIDDLYLIKNKNEINRREQLDLATNLFKDAIYWQKGNSDIPEHIKTALLMLDNLEIDNLSLNVFNSFIKELRDGLNSCLSTKGDIVLLGPAYVDTLLASKIIYSLINKYLKKGSVLTETSSSYSVTQSDITSPPSPPSNNPEKPIYLPEKFNTIYEPRKFNRRLEKISTQIKKQYYIALDNNFYEHINLTNYPCYTFYDENHKKVEAELEFYQEYNYYQAILFDYLLKVKNGECILTNTVGFTLDFKNKCFYIGWNNKVKNGIFIEYNLAICDTEEKFNNLIINQHQTINISISKDCPYRDISRDSFIAKTFKNGIEGGYTLTTHYKKFPGDLNKINYQHYEKIEKPKRQK